MKQEKYESPKRGWEILNLLAQYGPLSSAGVSRMLSAPMKSEKVCAALVRLRRKGLVGGRGSNLGMGLSFYHVSELALEATGVDEVLGVDADTAKRQRRFRGDLHHRETLKYWIFTLSKVLPIIEVVKRNKFEEHEETKRILRLDTNSLLHLPDAVIYFLSNDALIS